MILGDAVRRQALGDTDVGLAVDGDGIASRGLHDDLLATALDADRVAGLGLQGDRLACVLLPLTRRVMQDVRLSRGGVERVRANTAHKGRIPHAPYFCPDPFNAARQTSLKPL